MVDRRFPGINKRRLTSNWTYLETASRAELFDDADVGRVDAGADEAVEVIVRDFLHLKQFLLDGAVNLDMPLAQMLHGYRCALVRDERDRGTTVAFLLPAAAPHGKMTQVVTVHLALCGENVKELS